MLIKLSLFSFVLCTMTFFGGCSSEPTAAKKVFANSVKAPSTSAQSSSEANKTVTIGVDCVSLWGAKVVGGETIVGFSKNLIEYSENCDDFKKELLCTAGTLSEAKDFGFETCQKKDAKKCSTAWGISFDHGTTTKACETAAVNAGESCNCKQITCANGVADFEGLKFGACEKRVADTCDSPAGGVVGLGGHPFYSQTTVKKTESCDSFKQTRTCKSGGILDGEERFKFAACSVEVSATCTTPWGATFAEGNSVSAFLTSSVNYGQVCQEQKRVCQADGSFSGSFTNSICKVADAPASPPGYECEYFPDSNYARCRKQLSKIAGTSINLPATVEFAGKTLGLRSSYFGTSNTSQQAFSDTNCAVSANYYMGSGIEVASQANFVVPSCKANGQCVTDTNCHPIDFAAYGARSYRNISTDWVEAYVTFDTSVR